MRNTIVIHQPDFLPYLGFFHRLIHADMFIILDNAQYVNGTSQSWMNRDKIKTPNGEKWLTVSVKKSPRETPINLIELSENLNWKMNNLNLIRQNYKDSRYFDEIYPYLQCLYSYSGRYLWELNFKSIKLLLKLFDIKIPMILASSLNVSGNKNELLFNLLHKLNATHYLSGVGAKDYLDSSFFTKAGIEVLWQNFSHPVYSQLHGNFVPNLSSIDVLFNCGIEESRIILREA